MKIKVTIIFDEDWLLSRRDDEINPDDLIESLIMKALGETTDIKRDFKSDISELCLNISTTDPVNDGQYTSELREKISKLINDEYGLTGKGTEYTIEIDEIIDLGADYDDSSVPGRNALDRINSLVGVDEFKALANEIFNIADGLKKNNLTDMFAEKMYLLSADKGSGIIQYMFMFSDLVRKLGLFGSATTGKVVEGTVPLPGSQSEETGFTGTLSDMFKNYQKDYIVCLDISEWIDKLSNPCFVKLLDFIDGMRGKNIVFFSMPFVDPDTLKNVQAVINDRFYVKTISIPPFSSKDIRLIANDVLSEKDFTMEDDAWEAFDNRITEEKNDGKFYGIDTVRKVVIEMLYLKQLSDFNRGQLDKVIKLEDIKQLTGEVIIDERPGLEQLNDLIGVDKLREQIMQIVSQIEFAHNDSSVESPCIHMRFVGCPGTGKTTVARILGKILKEKGILRKGGFFEVFSRDLCGRYIGATAPITAAKCRDAYGSVLFIDEAYSLYKPDNERDFGKEAIDTLIAQMENHRSDFVVIMAGYTDEMETLMKSNQGLSSRMPYVIEFPNYTREQLFEIYLKMAQKWNFDEKFKETVKKFFDDLSDETINAKDFSNARFVRNLYERTWGKALLRCQMEGGDPHTLTAEDFTAASTDTGLVNKTRRDKRRVGF